MVRKILARIYRKRHFYVKQERETSNIMRWSPQGSILGSTLHLIYTSDASKSHRGTVVIYRRQCHYGEQYRNLIESLAQLLQRT